MRAVDTNIVIRLIVADDPEQTELAKIELENGIFVSHGVLMEAEWVLRSYYKLTPDQIGAALTELLHHRNVTAPHPESLEWALDRYLRGADFADMLHLIAARPYREFATFEKRLATRAGSKAPIRIVRLR